MIELHRKTSIAYIRQNRWTSRLRTFSLSLPPSLSVSLPPSPPLALSRSPLFGQGLDVKKHTCLSITLVNKKSVCSLSLSLSVCLSLLLSLSLPIVNHYKYLGIRFYTGLTILYALKYMSDSARNSVRGILRLLWSPGEMS